MTYTPIGINFIQCGHEGDMNVKTRGVKIDFKKISDVEIPGVSR